MKKLLIITNLFLAAASLYAQDASEAARLMQTDLSGTARSMGAGGAFSTVGADMSSMASNPAGIALYRSHEFAISGGGFGVNTSSTYLGQTQSNYFSQPQLNQAGFIFASRRLSAYDDLRYRRGGRMLDRFVLGLGYQKLADYTGTLNFSGINSQNSYAAAMAAQLNSNQNQIIPGNFSIPAVNGSEAGLFSGSGDLLTSNIGLPATQNGHISTAGSLNEFNVTLGFNVANTIYIGAGVGMPYVYYRRNETISESDANGNSYVSQYNYNVSGWGLNAKLGLIVKPVQWLRFGASIQSPTAYSLNQSEWGQTSGTIGDTANNYAWNNANYKFIYDNPMKGIFGASFYLSHWGFLSVDYELNDYAHSRYFFNGNDPQTSSEINSTISSTYRMTSALRAGAEFAYKKLRLRAGWAWSESPYANVPTGGFDGSKINYTAGIGYRGRSFFADLAYVYTTYKDFYNPYSDFNVPGPAVNNTYTTNTIVATIGWKFGLRRD